MRKLFLLTSSVVFVILSIVTVLNITYIDRVVVPSFPLPAGSSFALKTVTAGCVNHTTEQPGCVETHYQWKSPEQLSAAYQWYKSQKANASWVCTDSDRIPSVTGFKYLSCTFERNTYDVLFQPSGKETGITLIISSSI